ncbi:MAG: hypothetical protein KKB62_01790 [Nanoarchaeota archaeon]|nr:hypothetical protein [Nanoarchaeota archaeon]
MKTKISNFLKERQDRYKPEEANKLGLRRLNKIDFSGIMHLSDKKTNTGMILIKSGDLVISGINVEKGAIAVYQGKEDLLATIHYSSYEFDKNKIDIDYFKWFLKSDVFKKILLEKTRGGIKTELKPKNFLPLEIDLPNIEKQKEVLQKINSVQNEIKELQDSVSDDKVLLFKFKQSILSEAVQGKLVPQNPNDESARELFKKIKAEKEKLIKEGKIKKQKEPPTISEDEILKNNGNAKIQREIVKIKPKANKKLINVDEDQGPFKLKGLSEEEIEYLLRKRYKEYSGHSILSNKKEKYLIKSRFNESPQHCFLTYDIANYIKKFTKKVWLYETKKPDIVFEVNNKRYAIEVETGKALKHNKKQLLEKIKVLNEEYENRWFFVVADKHLAVKYNKLGKTHYKKYVITRILKIINKQ